MKNFICLVLRGTFLILYGLSMFKSKLALATTPTLDMPQIGIAEFNFTIRAPAGWKVRQNFRGKTLVLEDPLVSSHKGFDYSRTITVALSQDVRPIDAIETENLSRKLIRELGGSVSEFGIIESRVIDYRQKDDAILVFTSFLQGTVPMRQMHIFTSGAMNSVLLTYTDVESAFEAEGGLDKAWASMMSAELSGKAPRRYDGVLYTGTGVAFILTAAFLSKQLRRRKSKSELMAEEDLMFEDDDEIEVVRRPQAKAWQVSETLFAEKIG